MSILDRSIEKTKATPSEQRKQSQAKSGELGFFLGGSVDCSGLMFSPDELYQICWKNTQCYPWRFNQLGGRYVNGKPLPQDIRMQILQFAQIGIRPCDISREMKITHGCISKLLAKYKKTGSMEPGSVGIERSKFTTNERRTEKPTSMENDKLSSRPMSLDSFPPPLSCVTRKHTEGILTDELCQNSMRRIEKVVDKQSMHCREERSDTKNLITKPYKHSIDEILNSKENGEKGMVTTQTSTIIETVTRGPKVFENKSLPKKKAAPQTLRKQSQRSHFTRQQIEILQDEFMRNQYPGLPERQTLSRHLDVNETRIRVWFSNRRAKNRQTSRKIQECTADQIERSYLCCQTFPQYMPDILPGLLLDSSSNESNIFPLDKPQETHP